MRCSSNKVVVNLSYDCLKKMANDPEFAKEIEWNLSGEVTANSLLYSWGKRDGVELGGCTVTYDANGNRQSSCGGMRTANSGNSSTKRMQDNNRSTEERIRKRRKEKEEMEETAVFKKEFYKDLLDEYPEKRAQVKNNSKKS